MTSQVETKPTSQEIERFCSAAYSGSRLDIEHLLKKYGAQIAVAESEDGYHGFAMAACGGQLEMMRLMVSAGVDVNAKTTCMFSALTSVTHWSNIRPDGIYKSVAFLLAHGADINDTNKWGKTPLIEMAEQGIGHVVELLLEHDADIALQDEMGKTAIDHAKTPEIRALIENHIRKKEDHKVQCAVEAQTETYLRALKKRHAPKISLGVKR